ncbi:MAG: hypothetical protein L0Z50_17415 [Verrucomicrobiales bacterium]|nr:hypothetical protein [Verrucomicrobiales bacterium]
MGLVEDDQIPGNPLDLVRSARCELVRDQNNGLVHIEGKQTPGFLRVAVGASVQNGAGKRKLLPQLLLPLLAQGRGNDQQDAPTTFGPTLGNNHTGFDGLAESNFIRKDHALG